MPPPRKDVADLLIEILDTLKAMKPAERPEVFVSVPGAEAIPVTPIVPPLDIEDFVFEVQNISTLSATYQKILDLTVPAKENWELWMAIICSSQSENTATFRITFANRAPVEISPNVRIPIYFLLPDKLRLKSGNKAVIEVKSDGASTVKAFATLTAKRLAI